MGKSETITVYVVVGENGEFTTSGDAADAIELFNEEHGGIFRVLTLNLAVELPRETVLAATVPMRGEAATLTVED